jgi:hypothetical protein
VVVTEGFEELEAEFKEKGRGSGCGIEPESKSEDGGFGDRHPCVFSIEVGLFGVGFGFEQFHNCLALFG